MKCIPEKNFCPSRALCLTRTRHCWSLHFSLTQHLLPSPGGHQPPDPRRPGLLSGRVAIKSPLAGVARLKHRWNQAASSHERCAKEALWRETELVEEAEIVNVPHRNETAYSFDRSTYEAKCRPKAQLEVERVH